MVKKKSKKKVKANKKLIVVVVVITVLTISVVGSMWFYNQYTSADRNIRAGDALMAEGSFNTARKQYGRAVRKEPSNLSHIAKLQSAITSIVPVTPSEAQSLYGDYVGTLVHSARYNPLDADTQFALVYELYDAARLTGDLMYWQRLQSAADTVLERLRLDDPRRYEAKIYRGLSHLRIENNSMTDTFDDQGNIRFPGELDLLDALGSDPGNELAWGALAHGRMSVYYRLVRDGRIAQAEKNRQIAEKTMRDAIDSAGNSLEVSIPNAKEILLQRTRMRYEIYSRPGLVSEAAIEAMDSKVEDASNKLIATFDPSAHYVRTNEVVLLLLNGGDNGKELAVGILKQHLQTHADDHGRRFVLADLLHQLGRYDEAEREALAVLNAQQDTIGISAIEQFKLRPAAANILFQTARDMYKSVDDEAKDKYIASAKAHRETMLDLVSGDTYNPLLLEADGDLAMLQTDFQLAASKFEELIFRYPHPATPARVYYKSGISLATSGSAGLARERLADALRIEPGNLRNYIMKAEIEWSLSDYDAVAETLAALPEGIEDKFPEVGVLQDRIALIQSGEDSKFNDPVLAVIASADRSSSLGNTDEALELLQNAIDSISQPDWRLYQALSQVYYNNKDIESAIVWLDRAIEVNPDSSQLKQMRLVVDSQDRVAAVIAIVEASNLPEDEIAVTLAVQLFDLATNQSAAARRWKRMGNDEAARSATELSERAQTESVRYQGLAEESGADMTPILFVLFEKALRNKEWDVASGFIEQAKAKNADPMLTQSCEVRLYLSNSDEAKLAGDELLVKSKLDAAMEIAVGMTEKLPFSALAWRTLGYVHTYNQNLNGSLDAYNRAYSLAPDEVENVRLYLAVLVQSNADPQRIMRVAHLARASFPNNSQIQEASLGLELQFGDMANVLSHRYDRYIQRPTDRNNALQLALLLVNTKPARELILNPDGTERLSPKTWARMNDEQRRAAFEALQEEWNTTVDDIVKKAASEPDPDIRTAIIHASIERDRGRLNEAISIVNQFIEQSAGVEEYTTVVIAAANFLQESNRDLQAKEMLVRALDAQGDDKDISAALGLLLLNSVSVRDYDRAAAELSVAAKSRGNTTTYSSWIQALVLSGNFEEAEDAIDGFAGSNIEYAKAMLRALIHRRKSEIQLAQGRTDQARVELEKYRGSLSLAIAADKQNPVPYVQLCRSLINEFALTQDSALLEEALKVSEQGSMHNESFEEFAIVRTDVLQADGQLRRAIASLDAFLTKVPAADGVRQKLIEAHLDADDLEMAITVATAGVAVAPASATWHKRLGDLHARASDNREAAVQAYLNAIALEPSVQLLFIIDEITRTDQRLPYRNILKMTDSTLTLQHPIMDVIKAKALFGLGQRRDAERAMTSAWSAFKEAIASGWVPPSLISVWFADLTVLFAEDPAAGEQFALQIVGENMTPEELIGLAGYWWEQDKKHIDRSLEFLDKVILDNSIVGDVRNEALIRRGAYLVEVGHYQEGADIFEQLSRENPDSPIILNNLSYVVGVYLNRPEDGLKLAMQAAELAPRHASVIDTVSKLYELLGEHQKAAETLDFLLQIDPVNAKALARLALLYAEHLGQPQRAILLATRARSQQPRSPEALDALGWGYIQAGQPSKGESFLHRSLANGETSLAHLHLAQLVMMQKDYEKALGHLRIAEELSKDQNTLDRINTLKDDIRKIQVSVGQ